MVFTQTELTLLFTLLLSRLLFFYRFKLIFIIIFIFIIIMRKVQPFTISTKLSFPSDYTPDFHLSTPCVTSEPGGGRGRRGGGGGGGGRKAAVSLRLLQISQKDRHLLEHRRSGPSWEITAITFAGGGEPESRRRSCQQEVNLALEVSLFYQQADIILNDISRTLSQSEDSRQHFDKREACSPSIDDIAADITVLDRCVHHLSVLHPTLTARVTFKQQEVKTCWALLLQHRCLSRSVFRQSDPPESLCSQFGPKEPGPGSAECTTVSKPTIGPALLSTQRVPKHPASIPLSPSLRGSSRMVDCLTEGCCICSAGSKNLTKD
ncbi:uncharacterized protein LOC127352617 [Dicentrarchus labrax]|uniref:uncharacterized protein LOC127352617 n=1 Tax=Dicentrarchus labrax TaxID=13489 RepID=UPI0021F62151|nr:uncharacterized protein LOC127352617 [Dicentrarchus labrax]